MQSSSAVSINIFSLLDTTGPREADSGEPLAHQEVPRQRKQRWITGHARTERYSARARTFISLSLSYHHLGMTSHVYSVLLLFFSFIMSNIHATIIIV